MTREGTEIQTRRLSLTPFDHEDLDELLGLFRDPDVRRYLLDDLVVDEGWVEAEIEASRSRFAEGSAGLWAVRLAESPAIVGFTGLRPFFDPPRLQLLYGFRPQVWGEGLATEAGEAVCDFAFEELDFEMLEAAIDVPNERSGAVLERLGFREVRTTDEGPEGTTFFTLEGGERAPIPSMGARYDVGEE